MAVKDGDKWYNDARQEPFSIQARNGWYSDARIRPGYIIMREADYLEDRYRDPNVNPECNGDRAQCPTFHSGKFNSEFLANMPTGVECGLTVVNFSTLARFSLGKINRIFEKR